MFYVSVNKLQPKGQTCPLSDFVNKILLGHNYSHMFTHCLSFYAITSEQNSFDRYYIAC